MSHSSIISPCANIVRAHDYDRYLCALFAPASVRDAWFALFAFNHEVAVISELVSEPLMGHIRLAWWREALDEIYEGVPVRRHPVAQALVEVIKAHHLSRAPFDRIIAARASDLEPEAFASWGELEAYCRDTSSALLELCAACAGVPATEPLVDLGITWALIGLVRTDLGSDRAMTSEMTDAAAERLARAQAVPPEFAAFARACEFYLARLRSGKYARAPVRLIVSLLLRV